MAREILDKHPALHVLLVVLVLAVAAMLTIANVSTPTTGIPMFHVYTDNSTSGNGDIWVDFGLYGYCTWLPYAYNNESFILERFCSSFQVGYDPVPILNNAMYEPTSLFSASEASHLRTLSKALAVHLAAVVVAWSALVAVLLCVKVGTMPELLTTFLTAVLTVVGLGLDTALFVPMRRAIGPYSDYSSLSHGYWLVAASAAAIVCALVLATYEHMLMRNYTRDMAKYRKVGDGALPIELSLEPRRDWQKPGGHR